MKTNRIIQGDVLKELKKLPSAIAQAVIADPPYFNVLENEAWDTQWKSDVDYITWCEAWVAQSMRVLRDDGLAFIFGQVGKREHVFIHLMSSLTRNYRFHDLIIWDRAVGYNDRKDSFTPQYEMILVLRNGDNVKFNKDSVREAYDAKTIEVYLRDKRYKNQQARLTHLEKGKFATNIQRIPSLKGASKEKCGHPSQKPVHLIERLILCSTDPGDIVLDPFLGSGTTAVAAQSHDRKWIGVEKSRSYASMARCRIKKMGEKRI